MSIGVVSLFPGNRSWAERPRDQQTPTSPTVRVLTRSLTIGEDDTDKPPPDFVLEPTSDGQLNNPSGDMETFVQTAHRNGKKALLVLGGWTGSQWVCISNMTLLHIILKGSAVQFSDLLSEQRRMYRFVRNIKLAVRNNGFDGVDIDWVRFFILCSR